MDDPRVIGASRELAALYEARFSDREIHDKHVLWSTLCRSFLQQYVPEDGTVVDLGAGNCEFINAIQARRKIAVDLNADTGRWAAPGVEFLQVSSSQMGSLQDASVDTVFSSNFFEHLPDKPALLATLKESHRVLRPGGRIAVLMPNIRYVGARYWDYLDHYLPLTHLSLVEALQVSGFEVDRVIPRFLPYTVKGARVPVKAWLIRLYLRFPPAWHVMGGQMFVAGHSA